MNREAKIDGKGIIRCTTQMQVMKYFQRQAPCSTRSALDLSRLSSVRRVYRSDVVLLSQRLLVHGV